MGGHGKPNPLMTGKEAPKRAPASAPLAGATSPDAVEAIQMLGDARRRLKEEIAKVIVGQTAVIDDLLTAIFARGHCLMIGVPGLAKTLMVRTIAQAIDLTFNRIQFTPDLMPSDITGTEIIEEDQATGQRSFRFVKGPVFANILLADEINRTPPKTQAALLEAMQELQVTVAGQTYDLPSPFFVLATQNPIEQEGTYPLPEAQLDRFMFDIRVVYPKPEEELVIAKTTTANLTVNLTKALTGPQILKLQEIVRDLPVSDHVALYAVNLVRASRPDDDAAPDFTREFVSWGCGTRGVQYLVLGAKARAAIAGDYNVTCAHIREVAPLVMRHRVITNFRGEAEGVTPEKLVAMILEHVPEPGPEDYA